MGTGAGVNIHITALNEISVTGVYVSVGDTVSIIRYILIAMSAIAIVILLLSWTISGRSGDLLVFVAFAFFVLNLFYVTISRPTYRTSDFLKRVSTGLALASVELDHRSKEAEIHEAEMEKRRASDAEYMKHRLAAAREFLQSVNKRPLIGNQRSSETRQISYRPAVNDVPQS